MNASQRIIVSNTCIRRISDGRSAQKCTNTDRRGDAGTDSNLDDVAGQLQGFVLHEALHGLGWGTGIFTNTFSASGERRKIVKRLKVKDLQEEYQQASSFAQQHGYNKESPGAFHPYIARARQQSEENSPPATLAPAKPRRKVALQGRR